MTVQNVYLISDIPLKLRYKKRAAKSATCLTTLLQNELIAILRVLPSTNQTRATGWVLLGILGWGCAARSPNPDAISDQINVFFHIRFQSDLASKIHTRVY